MKRFLKFVHTVGAIGVLGALAAHLVLVAVAPGDSPAAFAAVRTGIHAISRLILLPSLLLVLVSGLLAMAIHRPFMDARWAWAKAFTGIAMFEGTLNAVQSNATRGAQLAARALEGNGDPQALAALLHHEWMGLWTIGAIAMANVALGVWRPRLRPKSAADSAPAPSEA